MDFFGNTFLAEIIATLFYNADKEVRHEMLGNQYFLETNEEDRVSVLCKLIRMKVSRNPFIRSFSIQAHSRPTTQRDALFVFRYKEEIKIGLVEAKLLRINGVALSEIWDWKNSSGQSHFTNQVINQQLWINEAAVWDMFIPNCKSGQHSPSLEQKGSSNIWANEMVNNPMISNPNQLWSYQDVLDAKTQYLSLYQIIKEIIKCNMGRKHDITGKSELEIISEGNEKKMTIPIPRNLNLSRLIIEKFFNQNKAIGSFNYFRFDDLFDSLKGYSETGNFIIPENVKYKKGLDEESLSEYLAIVKSSYYNNVYKK